MDTDGEDTDQAMVMEQDTDTEADMALDLL